MAASWRSFKRARLLYAFRGLKSNGGRAGFRRDLGAGKHPCQFLQRGIGLQHGYGRAHAVIMLGLGDLEVLIAARRDLRL